MDQFGSVKPNIYCWDCLKWSRHQIFNSQWLILLLHFSLSVFIYSLESFIHSCSFNRTTEVIWFNFLGLKTTDGVCVRWWLGHCVIDFDFLSICSAQPGDKHPTTAIKMWKMLPATNWFTFEKGPNCSVLLHFNHQCQPSWTLNRSELSKTKVQHKCFLCDCHQNFRNPNTPLSTLPLTRPQKKEEKRSPKSGSDMIMHFVALQCICALMVLWKYM